MFSVSEKSKNQIPYISVTVTALIFPSTRRTGDPCQRQTQDFPDTGCQPLNWGQNLLLGKIFAGNCMKMKEIGPRGGARPWHPLDPSMPAWIPQSGQSFKLSDITSRWNKNQPQNYQLGTCLRAQKENVKEISHIILPESLIPEMFSNFYENVPFFPKQDMWPHSFDNGGTRLAFGEVTFY